MFAVLLVLVAWYFVARSGLTTAFSESEPDVATSSARIINLRDLIVEQGTLESQSTVNGVCEVEGYENKIIFILPEGTVVKKDDVVVRFDNSQILKNIAEQELKINEAKSDMEDAKQEVTVQENENESAIRTAKQAYEFAKMDLNKYLEGDFEVNKSDLMGAISEADTAVQKAERELETMRIYVKRGFRQYEQLREAQQTLESAQLRLKRDQQRHDMLLRFEHKKSKAELEGKVVESEFGLETATGTAKAKLAKVKDKLVSQQRRLDMEIEQLERMKKNLLKFEIKAPQDGTIAYPTEQYYGPDRQIREGAMVYQNQTVFYLPNMKKMQVKVGIHESLVSKVKPGQPATVRVDAFSNIPLKGKVEKVATLAAQNFFSSAKNYTAVVMIDEIPEGVFLKPGMTTQVEIVAGVYRNVLTVPMQAVATNYGKKYVYVVQPDGSFQRRLVEVGNSNVSFVEITSGLEEGEVVALDAFQRSIKDFGSLRPEEALADPDLPDNQESDAPAKSERGVPASSVGEPDSSSGNPTGETDQPIAPTSTEDKPAEIGSPESARPAAGDGGQLLKEENSGSPESNVAPDPGRDSPSPVKIDPQDTENVPQTESKPASGAGAGPAKETGD